MIPILIPGNPSLSPSPPATKQKQQCSSSSIPIRSYRVYVSLPGPCTPTSFTPSGTWTRWGNA
eukprot:806318-Amphidinium_carterae.1